MLTFQFARSSIYLDTFGLLFELQACVIYRRHVSNIYLGTYMWLLLRQQ